MARASLDDARRQVAVERLEGAVERAKRKSAVPFPPSFIQSRDETSTPPLARMIQGGRGGEVRLRVYLTMSLMATRRPFDIRTPPTPAGWSRLLALPPATGPRRVSDALTWLGNNNLIQMERRSGATSSIALLDPGGFGGPYVRPSEAGRYVSVPLGFWSNGWILDLSPVATALLLALLDSQGGHRGHRYIVASRKRRYGLSSDSWTRGRYELEHHGLLDVKRAPQGSDFDPERMRNAYLVDVARLDRPPQRA